jgi:hypothetical protein
VIVIGVIDSVSVVAIVADEDSVIENSKVPDVDADQKLTSVTTSLLVPAQDGHAGVVVALIEPAEAPVAHATASRVVVLETLEVPAVPGSPVWSCANNAEVVQLFNAVSALSTESPSAMMSPRRWC